MSWDEKAIGGDNELKDSMPQQEEVSSKVLPQTCELLVRVSTRKIARNWEWTKRRGNQLGRKAKRKTRTALHFSEGKGKGKMDGKRWQCTCCFCSVGWV
jgi:hypothetical protein